MSQITNEEKFYFSECIIKMENNKLKEINFKNCMCYYFDDTIKIEGFDPDNILIDKKSHQNILFITFCSKV